MNQDPLPYSPTIQTTCCICVYLHSWICKELLRSSPLIDHEFGGLTTRGWSIAYPSNQVFLFSEEAREVHYQIRPHASVKETPPTPQLQRLRSTWFQEATGRSYYFLYRSNKQLNWVCLFVVKEDKQVPTVQNTVDLNWNQGVQSPLFLARKIPGSHERVRVLTYVL